MSLRSQASYKVPDETVRVVHAVLPKGNVYLRLADTFGSLFQDADFASHRWAAISSSPVAD